MASSRDRLLSVIYHSAATPGFSSIDLSELLTQDRAKNRAYGVTGMLLAENGRFLQALEGPEGAVRGLMETIAADPRHQHVRVLSEEDIRARRFPDWSMAEGHVGEIETMPLAEYLRALMGARGEMEDPPGLVQRVVDWFRVERR